MLEDQKNTPALSAQDCNTESVEDETESETVGFTTSPALEELKSIRDYLGAVYSDQRDEGLGNLWCVVGDLVDHHQLLLNAHHNAMLHLVSLVEGLALMAGVKGTITDLRLDRPFGQNEPEPEVAQ